MAFRSGFDEETDSSAASKVIEPLQTRLKMVEKLSDSVSKLAADVSNGATQLSGLTDDSMVGQRSLFGKEFRS